MYSSSYNQPCNSSNFTCKTLTEQTLCDITTRTCSCGPYGYWNSSKCQMCPQDWIFYRGSCFKSSSVPISFQELQPPNKFRIACNDTIARLAILKNTDFNNSLLTVKYGFNTENWIDAWRNVGDLVFNSSSRTPGYTLTIDSNWMDDVGLVKQCAFWNAQSSQFSAERCREEKSALCEIVIF